MAILNWDQDTERLYETGVDRGVVYPYNSTSKSYPAGYAWNGLTGVDESPSGAEETALWADNDKYLSLRSKEEFGGTINAYTFPDEFADLDGTAEIAPGVRVAQQQRKPFGFTYRTLVGNDTEGNDYGYKIHLVYGAVASPSSKSYETVNNDPNAITFSWEFSTTPVAVNGHQKTAHLVIDSTKFTTELQKRQLTAIEDALYGTANDAAYLPLPDRIVEIINSTT